jgi:tRNA-2-methylthio-N6-dimethylallyladenosine synthase
MTTAPDRTTRPDLSGLRFAIRTFGCQMNENDSEHIAGVLAEAGARPAASAGEADVVIVNTCAVREKSEEKLYSYLGRLAALRKNKPGLLIGIAGCVAELRRDALFRRKPGPDFVVGPDRYRELADIVARSAGGRRLETGRSPEWHEFAPGEIRRDSPASAYVTVMEGCDNRCAYCVVPFSRGSEKFRPMSRILDEVRDLARNDYREIQLLGQNVDSYRDPESGTGLAGLLREVCAVEGPAWMRFLTSHPRNFTAEIVAAMAELPRICRQLHLPVQSGSTAVLERMKRGYTREAYLELVRRLREAVPGIVLSTDLIVGFPGETEEDFAASLDLLREVRFGNLFSFRYSPRPLTEAARLDDDVPPEVKARRLSELQALQKAIQSELHEALVGRTIRVLALGRSKKDAAVFSGRDEALRVVNFTAPGDPTGGFVDVLVTGSGPYSLRGQTA